MLIGNTTIKFTLLLIASFVFKFGNTQDVQATLDYKRFYNQQTGHFLEVYLRVNLTTTTLKTTPAGLHYSEVEITEIIKKGDSIVDFRKNNLASPMMTDSALYDFTDQQRFVLKPGVYDLEISIKDNFKEGDLAVTLQEKIEIDDVSAAATFSDIELLEAYVKSDSTTKLTKAGYDLYPYVSAYYPHGTDKIAFYTEMYHLGKVINEGEKFLMVYYLENYENGVQLSNYSKMTKMESSTVVPVLGALDISTLKTGNYNLVVEARNKTNDVVAKNKIFFQRNNPLATLSTDELTKISISTTFVEKYKDIDSLSEYIACLRPICEELERGMVDKLSKSEDTLLMQQFMFSFWSNRNELNPEKEWLTYKKQVDYVNGVYGTRIKKGYETDRGRVYLQYGPPNQLTDRPNEPSSYPYQIWQYYKVGRFNNKKFIFYMPDLVTNDYQLLHSDVPGEMKNFRWETMLNSRNTPNGDVDSPGNGNFNHYGSRGEEFFKNPR